MNELVLEGEYVEDLQRGGLMIIQPREGYRFSADSVLLAHFVADTPVSGTVVDLGTGSGVMLFLLGALCPGLKLIGLELQETAADRAHRSVLLNKEVLDKFASHIEIIQGDLRQAESYIDPCSVDVVISNPPFIAAGAGPVNKNTEIALSRQELSCSLEDVFKAGKAILKPKGRFFLVHKPSRLADICCLGRLFSLEPKRLRMVQARPDSDPNMILMECVKGAAPGLKAMNPLVLVDDNGNPSAEAEAIYLS